MKTLRQQRKAVSTMRYKYVVQHTGRPYGPAESPDMMAWFELSRHTSYSAAKTARDKHIADMREVCGTGAWNDHFRIVPTHDAIMTRTILCESCNNVATIKYVWHAMTPLPNPDDFIPDDWVTKEICRACYEKERGFEPGESYKYEF